MLKRRFTFNKGHRIKVQDLALLVAAGVKYINVYEPLKVGILSMVMKY